MNLFDRSLAAVIPVKRKLWHSPVSVMVSIAILFSGLLPVSAQAETAEPVIPPAAGPASIGQTWENFQSRLRGMQFPSEYLERQYLTEMIRPANPVTHESILGVSRWKTMMPSVPGAIKSAIQRSMRQACCLTGKSSAAPVA